MLQVRTDRDHVHIGVGFLDDTAFQTGMHNLCLRLLSVQIQISLLHDFQDRRIDIDIFVEKKDYQNFIEMMKANDFYEIKMEYTTLNHTVWEDAKNRIVDLHCFEYTGEGEILYEGDCFPIETFSGKGKIEEIEVSCIEPYSQVMFHLGYEFDENDVHDVKLLCETFHIEIPNEYR